MIPMDITGMTDEDTERRLVDTWRTMDEADKGHFINQVALALSIWGSDNGGRRMVVEVLRHMAGKETSTLADFGLFIEDALQPDTRKGMAGRIKRAAMIIEGYRIKNALSSVPHREIGV